MLGGSPSKIHSCQQASSGVSLSKGFHVKHPLSKSRNFLSLQSKIHSKVFVSGFRTLPLEF